MTDRKISILGCGWLGLPLAQYLLASGWCVKGSTTTPEKVSILEKSGIIPFVLQCNPYCKPNPLFFNADIFILTIPFRKKLENPYYYKQQIDGVMACLEDSPVRSLIFTSSTSIYPATTKIAQESDRIVPDNPRAQVLQEIEQMLLNNKRFSATIIRFAGMYGGARKIGRFLSGKKKLGNGRSPVNLIHLEDCVGVIGEMIHKGISNDIFNACSDAHPTRETLYTQAAARLGLSSPQFLKCDEGSQKIVDNTKLKNYLNYIFKRKDLLCP